MTKSCQENEIRPEKKDKKGNSLTNCHPLPSTSLSAMLRKRSSNLVNSTLTPYWNWKKSLVVPIYRAPAAAAAAVVVVVVVVVVDDPEIVAVVELVAEPVPILQRRIVLVQMGHYIPLQRELP